MEDLKDYFDRGTTPVSYTHLDVYKRQDLYNAIDLVIDKLEGQIRKYKTRLNRKSKDNKLAFNLASIEPLEEEEDVLVKTKTITPKPMDMERCV